MLLFCVSSVSAITSVFNTSNSTGGGDVAGKDGSDNNFGARIDLRTHKRSNGELYRSLVWFNTSSISPTATVSACNLTLELVISDDVNSYYLAAYRNLQDVVEGNGNNVIALTNETTWNSYRHNCGTPCGANAGAWATPMANAGDDSGVEDSQTIDRYATPEDNITISNALGDYTWDVTRACQSWINNSWSWDYGLILIGDETTAGSRKQFASFQHSTGTTPRLTVVYTDIDTTPPSITLLRNESTLSESTHLLWTCSEACNFTIGIYNSSDMKSDNRVVFVSNNTPLLVHDQNISGLEPFSHYSVNLSVWDVVGNEGVNDTFNFTTIRIILPEKRPQFFVRNSSNAKQWYVDFIGNMWLRNDLNVTGTIITDVVDTNDLIIRNPPAPCPVSGKQTFQIDSNGSTRTCIVDVDNVNGTDISINRFNASFANITGNTYLNNTLNVIDGKVGIGMLNPIQEMVLIGSVNITGALIMLSNVTIGQGAKANGTDSIAIGSYAQAKATQAIAIGGHDIVGTQFYTSAEGEKSIAMGNDAHATGFGAVALGSGTDATASRSVAIAPDAQTTGADAVSIGRAAAVTGAGGVAIGFSADASSQSTAIGNLADATGFRVTSVGSGATATGNFAFVLGYQSTASAAQSGAIGYQVDNAIANSTKFSGDVHIPGDVGIGTTSPSVKLDVQGGNANVSGNITAENVFLPQFIFPHTNVTIPVNGANVWTNLSFDQEPAQIKQGIVHTFDDGTNQTFTINTDGIYDISYNFDVIDTSLANSEIDVAGRAIYRGGTEINGSVFETDIIRIQVETELSHNFLVELEKGDELIFQFIADDADIEMSTHGSFGDHPNSVSVVIKKYSNIPW